jgi:hypothetical protein
MACSIDVFPDSLIPIIGINEYLKDISISLLENYQTTTNINT